MPKLEEIPVAVERDPSRRRHYTPLEVAEHNQESDMWVTYLGRVYDLTALCEEYKGSDLIKPIVQAAGTDITHWFDKSTLDIRRRIDEETGCSMYHTPMGRFVHVPPRFPSSSWKTNFGTPWWKNHKYCIGILSSRVRHIRLVNTLTSQEHCIKVCEEETINEILLRYLVINQHANSYTWKFEGRNLDMEQTLQENGIPNQNAEFFRLGMDEEHWRPAILLYFNDDLSEM
ncbi:cytochrome b5 domain-containing protein 1-like [Sycon ciliatum]|uniref:cytochrome b5 domain-containing protein 1-like n=1 Tax=Sycon ciliatum TaxID=27933 RepID=UPI0031F693E5